MHNSPTLHINLSATILLAVAAALVDPGGRATATQSSNAAATDLFAFSTDFKHCLVMSIYQCTSSLWVCMKESVNPEMQFKDTASAIHTAPRRYLKIALAVYKLSSQCMDARALCSVKPHPGLLPCIASPQLLQTSGF